MILSPEKSHRSPRAFKTQSNAFSSHFLLQQLLQMQRQVRNVAGIANTLRDVRTDGAAECALHIIEGLTILFLLLSMFKGRL